LAHDLTLLDVIRLRSRLLLSMGEIYLTILMRLIYIAEARFF
jgi:hypothetical protein